MANKSTTVPLLVRANANYQKPVGEAEVFPDGTITCNVNDDSPEALALARAIVGGEVKGMSIYYPEAKVAADAD